MEKTKLIPLILLLLVVISVLTYVEIKTSIVTNALDSVDVKLDYVVKNTQAEYDSTSEYFKRFSNNNLTYYDSTYKIFIAVESNGRRIYGLQHGKIIWNVDPVKNMSIYREKYPVISCMGKARDWEDPSNSGKYISVSWTNSRFGTIDIMNGTFKLSGQD